MYDFLNQGWVGSVIGILGLIVGGIGLILYLRSRVGGRPLYQMRSIRLIGKQEQQLPTDITILFKGREVPRLTLTKVWLWNGGTETINGSQIVQDDPLMFSLEQGDEILVANVEAATRPTNKFSVTISPDKPDKAIVSFDYLDPNDGARIELLHTGKRRYPHLYGTIRGIPKGLRPLTTPSGDAFARVLFRVSRQRGFAYGIMLFLGIASIIVGLLPDPWLDYFRQALKKSDVPPSNDSFRYAMLIVGFIYALMPGMLLFSRRRRYPSSLDEVDKDPSGKETSK